MQDQLSAEEMALVEEIKAQIKEACDKSQYLHLCQRVQTDYGMAYVVNRAIKMMANDRIHLSSALAYLESEMEGMD